MLISTFELLVKRQLPKSIQVPGEPAPRDLSTAPLSRPLIQGYFLSIANVGKQDASLILNFKSVTSLTSLELTTAIILDQAGTNTVDDLIPDIADAYKFSITLSVNTTCLFILQPDILLNPNVLNTQDFEERGYVEVELDSAAPAGTVAEFLITPEHRGTFYRSGITEKTPEEERQLGEIAYSLPTASGGSYFKLEK